MSRPARRSPRQDLPWLQRPASIRRLWWLFAVILLLTVVAEFLVELHPHFGADGWPGFHAIFGFVSCVAMVLVAKLIGYLLKRREDYYERD